MSEEKIYLTKKAINSIKKECESLKKLRSLKLKKETVSVLESEDLNPEYLSFQEDMVLLETRLAELENVVKNFKLITIPPKSQRYTVNLGATILVEHDGQTGEFEVVGTLEANPAMGKISNESAVGQALLGKKIGEVATVPSPLKITYKILKIKYERA